MIKNCLDALINLIDEVRAVAGTGLNFTENPYDRDHYERLLKVTSQLLSDITGLEDGEISDRFRREVGYLTPKIGVNAAIFDDRKRILLEKRIDDGKWGLPSGWVEVGETLVEAVVREIKEETGLDVEPTHIINVYESTAYAPHRPHNAVGILYLCERRGGELKKSYESTDIGFFNIDEISEWHVGHEEQAAVALCFINQPDPFSAIRLMKG